MNYIQYKFSITDTSLSEVLIALLSDIGFESFIENENSLEAFISEPKFKALEDDFILEIQNRVPCSYTSEWIKEKNWNQEWESNYPMVVVDSLCSVRAPFHSGLCGIKYDIVIEPKMSFGTAHHETTFQMIQLLLETDIDHKDVLDMGCGTAVLAILASKMGATTVDAVDNDEWAYRNSLENVQMNKATNVKVFLGDATLPGLNIYDILIVNINRNILLQDMNLYSRIVKTGGLLFLSGFYLEDLPMIIECADKLHFVFESKKVKNNWVAARFKKV